MENNTFTKEDIERILNEGDVESAVKPSETSEDGYPVKIKVEGDSGTLLSKKEVEYIVRKEVSKLVEIIYNLGKGSLKAKDEVGKSAVVEKMTELVVDGIPWNDYSDDEKDELRVLAELAGMGDELEDVLPEDEKNKE